jgi:acetyl esterase
MLAGFASPILADGRAIPARAYSPLGASEASLPGLVYFHGGGLVSGGLDTHDALFATLAALGGCRVVAVDYRLAPEARFPAAHEDARDALAAVGADLARWNIDPRRLGVGGDSAGGNLAIFAARRAGVPLRLQLLLCPVLDPLAREPSRHERASGFLIDEATMERYWDAYRVDGLSPDDPRVAPLGEADFSGLPPAHIHTAECDPLRDEGARYARELERADVFARHVDHPGLVHHFYGLGGIIPKADAALRAIATDLASAFASPRE